MKKWVAIICCVSLFAIPFSASASSVPEPIIYGIDLDRVRINNTLDFENKSYELPLHSLIQSGYIYQVGDGVIDKYYTFTATDTKPVYSSLGLPSFNDTYGDFYSDIDMRGKIICIGILYPNIVGPPALIPTVYIEGQVSTSQYFEYIGNISEYIDLSYLSYSVSPAYYVKFHYWKISSNCPYSAHKLIIKNISGTSEWYYISPYSSDTRNEGNTRYRWSIYTKYNICYINYFDDLKAENITTDNKDYYLSKLDSVNGPNYNAVSDPINSVNSADYTLVSGTIYPLLNNPLIISLMTIVLGLAIGSYFLFGRKS